MCCAVQSPLMEIFFSQNEEQEGLGFECFPVLKQGTLMNTLESCDGSEEAKDKMEMLVKDKTGGKPQFDGRSPSEEEPAKKKKKKWKKLSLAETGFNLSLFPRPTTASVNSEEEEEKICKKVEDELNNFEEILSKCKRLHYDEEGPLFDGKVNRSDKFLRRDRDRRVQKASKQVKTKYCSSVKNNDGRKKLFIHYRLFKLIHLEVRRMTFLPSQKSYSNIEIKNKGATETRSKLKPYTPAAKPAPVQNLRHTLHETNAPTNLESNLVNLLISLQHRELTPEDYELLLQLDDSVAPKTVDKSLLTSFKTDTVIADALGEICPVCMDPYEIGQNRKFLPCDHVFHVSCIDMWLENSSQNCPVDGLPVDRNS